MLRVETLTQKEKKTDAEKLEEQTRRKKISDHETSGTSITFEKRYYIKKEEDINQKIS